MAKKKHVLRIVSDSHILPGGIRLQVRTHAVPARNRLGNEVGGIEGTAVCSVSLALPFRDWFQFPELVRLHHDNADHGGGILGSGEAAARDALREVLAGLMVTDAESLPALLALCLRRIRDVSANPHE